ncbi:hypothetical protein Bca101_020336 [Brassica carinata]
MLPNRPLLPNRAIKTKVSFVPQHILLRLMFLLVLTSKKVVETHSRARDIRCFKCQGLGHYANKCPNQRVMMIFLENGEVESGDEEEDKEDRGPVFDEEEEPFDYPHHGSLLVARKPMDEAFDSIFDEVDDHLVDDFGPTFDADSGPIFDEEDNFEYPAHGPLLVTRRSLSVQPKTNEKEQRENLFHSRCLISDKVCSIIIVVEVSLTLLVTLLLGSLDLRPDLSLDLLGWSG